MAITTLDQLLAAHVQRLPINKSSAPSSNIYWKDQGLIGSVPAAFAVPAGGRVLNNGDVGTIPFVVPPAGQASFLSGLRFGSGAATSLMIVDRLVDWGGASGIVTTSQAIVTPALPRYTDGEDVELWIETFVGTGATAQSVSVTYTNSQGVGGRVGTSITTLQNTGTGSMLPVTLQAGDTGVRSVESLLFAGSTGTAGNVGVALLRRLANIAGSLGTSDRPFQERDWLALGLPPVPDTAALCVMSAPGQSSTSAVMGELDVVQG